MKQGTIDHGSAAILNQDRRGGHPPGWRSIARQVAPHVARSLRGAWRKLSAQMAQR